MPTQLAVLLLVSFQTVGGTPSTLGAHADSTKRVSVSGTQAARVIATDTLLADTLATSTAANGAEAGAAGPRRPAALFNAPTAGGAQAQARPKAISYSDWYGRRLMIHRIGSYAALPLFVTEYALGNKLLNSDAVSSSTRNAHSAVAGAIAGVFAVNTVTGLWNLWDSRKDPAGRTRRVVHTLLMLTADAGFVATGLLADEAGEARSRATTHRNVALGSMVLSTVGGAMMFIWKD